MAMFERIQSILLAGMVFMSLYYISFPIWTATSIDNNVQVVVTAYSLVASSGLKILFPYTFSFVFAFIIMMLSVFTLTQYRNIALQRKLIVVIIPTCSALLVCSFLLFSEGQGGCTIPLQQPVAESGYVVPLTIVVLASLAGYLIQRDYEILNDDRLR